jgi:hypothetical protein
MEGERVMDGAGLLLSIRGKVFEWGREAGDVRADARKEGAGGRRKEWRGWRRQVGSGVSERRERRASRPPACAVRAVTGRSWAASRERGRREAGWAGSGPRPVSAGEEKGEGLGRFLELGQNEFSFYFANRNSFLISFSTKPRHFQKLLNSF